MQSHLTTYKRYTPFMKFEVSERIISSAPQNIILAALEEQFRKTSGNVTQDGEVLKVNMIEASFGSINRDDKTSVKINAKDDGYILLADVQYNPSIFFWIFILIGIFTTVGWLIPVAFFLIQKNSVKQSVESTFSRIRNEFSDSASPKPSNGLITDLESLADLKSKGIITDEEFLLKKAQILGI